METTAFRKLAYVVGLTACARQGDPRRAFGCVNRAWPEQGLNRTLIQ